MKIITGTSSLILLFYNNKIVFCSFQFWVGECVLVHVNGPDPRKSGHCNSIFIFVVGCEVSRSGIKTSKSFPGVDVMKIYQ